MCDSAEQLRSKLTLDEKCLLIAGVDGFYTQAVERLGIPRLSMADASMGLRSDTVATTAFPAFICLAATWNTALAADYGRCVGEEFRAAGIDVLLGPGVNLYRVPQCGRNFEYLGEDPCLASELAVPYIRAVQETGVAATVKHFVCNNSDWNRCSSNSVVDERTLREIYFPVFEAAVKRAGVQAVMTSYNLLNGEYAGENAWLLRKVLKGDWGYEGLVMSDWDGLWDALPALKSGLHLEMPGKKTLTPAVVRGLLADGSIAEADIDEMALGVLRFVLEVGRLRSPGEYPGRCSAHAAVALETAREGIVLLRNEAGLLPLDRGLSRLVVVGPNADPTPTSGGGAACVNAVDPVSIIGGIKRIAPEVAVLVDEAEIADAAAVLVCVGYGPAREEEGSDRPFELPPDQVELIQRCIAANANTVVILTCGGGVEMASWIDGVQAVVQLWYPGENGALALSEILFGIVNPSGRLPITIEGCFADNAASGNYLPEGAELYEEVNYASRPVEQFDVNYAEGVFTGYRHFDAKGIEPLFPFGHGLSYTTFSYSGLVVTPTAEGGATITFTVRNTGGRAGAEVAQVYIAPPPGPVPRPPRELKGFAKVELAPGEERTLRISLERRAFAYWCSETHDWVVAPDEYVIHVGASSRDIRLTGGLEFGRVE